MTKVTLEMRDGGVRILTLNDAPRRNILDVEMCADLLAAVKTVASDADTRVLVVAGEGTVFCGGADMPAIFGDTDRSVAEIRENLQEVYESFLALCDLKIPTIAAVHGPAIGAGLNLAMVCDIRVVGPHAVLSASFSRIGLHPGGGCTWFLVQAMGRDKALKMLLDGGSKKGRDCLDSGLATYFADDPLEQALMLADRYAALDPQLSRDVKNAVDIAASGDFAATLAFEGWAQASAATKPELQSYVRKFDK